MLLVLVACLALACLGQQAQSQDVDIEDLLSQMTNEEKCGQMNQINFEVIIDGSKPELPIDEAKLRDAIEKYHVGSVFNAPFTTAQAGATWQAIIKKIHDFNKNHSRLYIPIVYGIDSIHGANYVQEATIFPQNLNLAATFNPEAARIAGRVTAQETRASGIPWNFNPVLDVGRRLIWSRLFETYGEDTLVNSRMGVEYVHGHQGNGNLKNRSNTATCLKHFIGYSNPFSGRDRAPALIPENILRETYLPPFEAGLLAGSPTVMLNSGEVNGVPGHANAHYINDILKGELNFQGFTVSDWDDVNRLFYRDGVAENLKEAVRLAVMSGVDMSMQPDGYSFFENCVELAGEDSAFAERITDANRRILTFKERLGLFQDQFLYPNADDLNTVNTEASHQSNLELAQESIILAKNENNALPLDASSDQKILITGPTANLLRVFSGGWTYQWQGSNEGLYNEYGRQKFTMRESIERKLSDVDNLEFVQGADFNGLDNLEDAVQAANESDVIVLCLGEDTYTEAPGVIKNMYLERHQIQLAEALLDLGKTTVIVYMGGRPRVMTKAAERADAVVLAFLPGTRGGEAVADVLFGDYNPSGRLPITYPTFPNGITTYDHKWVENRYDNNYDNLFPFGHGLSYTSFSYSDITLSTNEINDANTDLVVRVTVTNSGARTGKETVILYVQDKFGSVTRPERMVRGFEKITLEAGEAKQVEFTLSVQNDLSFVNILNRRVYEAGTFKVYIADKSADFTLNVSS